MGEFKKFFYESRDDYEDYKDPFDDTGRDNIGELTPEKKAQIDAMSYEQLLKKWRFAKAGDPLFVGETGDYYGKRMNALRDTVDHVAASKHIGWKKGD